MDRFRAWYRAPEREILRREVAWFGRWLRRPWIAVWLAVYVALMCGWILITRAVARDPSGAWFAGSIFGLFATTATLVNLALWIRLIHARTLVPFSPGRRRDLLLTPLGAADLWPGLLTAPALFAALIAATGGVVGVVGVTLNAIAGTRNFTVIVRAGATGAGTLGSWVYSFPIQLAISVGSAGVGLLLKIAAGAFAAWQSLPNQSTETRIFLRVALAYVACYAPATVFSWVLMFGTVATVGASPPPMLAEIAGVIGILSVPIVSGAIAFVILLFSWRGLIHPKTWEKIRACGEMPGV